MDRFYVWTVLVDKSVGIARALKMFKDLTGSKNKGYYETDTHYRFKNINKIEFDPTTFKLKKIDDIVSVVYGRLRSA